VKRLFLCLAAAQILTAGTGGSIAIRAERLYTSAGPVITDGVVLIVDGKIKAVGPAAGIKIPAGILIRKAKVATPGLVDAHSTVGFSGLLNQPHDQDQLEGSAPIQPELRAGDAYNGRDPLVAWLRSLGVTTVHTGHGPGALISGQTFIVKTHALDSSGALVFTKDDGIGGVRIRYSVGAQVYAPVAGKPDVVNPQFMEFDTALSMSRSYLNTND